MFYLSTSFISQHRDPLHPTYPPCIHYKWVVDLVTMPKGIEKMCYIVLAREDLTNHVEGRALRSKNTYNVCKFLLEDVISCFGYIEKVVADRGELNAREAKEFFERHDICLSLTTAYNLEANACNGDIKQWPRFLPFALWADRMTCTCTTGYMPAELMYYQKPLFPIQSHISIWSNFPWSQNMSTDDFLSLCIKQLEQGKLRLDDAAENSREYRIKNRHYFDKTHRLHPKTIEVGDWVLIYDSTFDSQYDACKNLTQWWFGPYIVSKVNNNALCELNGAALKTLIAGKTIKLFKKRDNDEYIFDDDNNEADS
ncbi:hypothetical protein KP509_15G012900 [Ceratopteris richardii]|uniref:Integrase catalytic domain-containing protein n=1 Tax=Ceratopteris richardii TaxID=49495 RepID=A0A8T2T4L8_CERRI|nr:hypothetical protein KP509_15G012900 [Ceratopteris richardii]